MRATRKGLSDDAKVYLLASMRNCKTLDMRFRALLTEGGAERLELVRATAPCPHVEPYGI